MATQFGGLSVQSYSGIITNASADTSTTSAAAMAGMTVTPPAGTYMVWFSTDVSSATSGSVVSASFYVAGVATTNGQVKFMPFAGGTLTAGSQRIPFSLNDYVTVNGSQAISIEWFSSTAGATTALKRMTYLKV